MLTGLKRFTSYQQICSTFSLKMPQHLKCLATVIYDFPLITIPVSNCHLFSDINISQGSVAMWWRCGGIFSYHFTANLSLSLTVIWQSYQSYHHEFGCPVFFKHKSILVAWSSGRTSIFGWRAFARPVAGVWPLMWVNHPLQVHQLGQLSLSSFRGR